MRRAVAVAVCALLAGGLLVGGGCSKGPVSIGSFPLDSVAEIVDREAPGVVFEPQESSDGKGSLQVDASEVRSVRLFELRPSRNLAGRRIVLTARMRSVAMRGRAFPELWVHVPGHNEIQVRNAQAYVVQTTKWKELRVEYVCAKDERPERLGVNVVIDGIGRVWIDDVQLTAERPE